MSKIGNILDLDGRVALVTGAGQGVGRQIALHLGSYNAGGVIVNDFYRERAEAVAAEVSELGLAAMAAQADVGDFKSVQAMVEAGTKKFGRIDILVNNAGNFGPILPQFLSPSPSLKPNRPTGCRGSTSICMAF